ncbi:mucin-associated surface protein (MASP), putative [Trypanosoma cruzi]|uniref:Mucin-associated surface protein (MASP), putative n=1 Tax=Trypanosoma cruzi (strain CL Brener) TaxID=353153 RepID=Q4E008_TRYCC|nr:mucin-associated surface protein (MASP), putative [Trypanosoma cruzi]EAN98131.1 mucin-associated surface protein (MASP), putative [Trypanosoma cruzi]|eukprot:XP_819982.1 mucin-associated surface protein (MASP) [Trypanosoma cruzi strain CL Brener]
MAMMADRVLLVCALCVLWCGAGGGYGLPAGYCADGGLDNAKPAKGMDGEVVLMKRDCVTSTAFRGVVTAVPAAEDGDLNSPGAGVGTGGKRNSDAEEPPVVDAESGLTSSGSGAASTASSPAVADKDGASRAPVLGAVGPKQQPAVVSGGQDDSSSGGREEKESEEAGSESCGEEPSSPKVCPQPRLVGVELTPRAMEERRGQKDNASVANNQSEEKQQEDGVPHVPETRASVQTLPAPAPAEGHPEDATGPFGASEEHATAPSSSLTRDALNGDSQRQTPQPQTTTGIKQTVPVIQGLSEGVQENQKNVEDGKKRKQVDSTGSAHNAEHDSAAETHELSTASSNTRSSEAPGNEPASKSLSGNLRSSTAGAAEQAKAPAQGGAEQKTAPEEKEISEELPPTAAEVEVRGGPSAPPPKPLPQSALPSSKEVPDTMQSTEDPQTKGIEPAKDARQNAITEGQAETTSPSSPVDDAAANDADKSNAEIPNDGSAVHAGVPEEEERQEQVEESHKQTSFTSTAKKFNTTIQDSDGSTAVSHTTSPLLILIFVAYAAAAVVAA